MPNARLAPILAAAALAACTLPKEDAVSPYPARTVSGTVSDVRSGPVEGARVLVWNAFDTGSATTGADGSFTLTVDGSDAQSWWRVTKADVRTREGRVAVGDPGVAGWSIGVVSKDDVLFATVGGDVHVVRAGTGAVSPIATGADFETTPCFQSSEGLVLRWANATANQVMEAAWDGSGAHPVYTAPDGYTLQEIACGERGTLVARTRIADQAQDVVIADDPPGATFSYSWPGVNPSFSPPAFGWFGPQPIDGNMAAFAEGDGVYTAFPYFTDAFLVPEKIPGTQSGDVFPRWSPFRQDGTLHLGFQRSYRVWLTEVTAGTNANVWSSPASFFGGSGAEPHVTDLAWAPEIEGQGDRMVVVDHPMFYTGDLVVVGFDPRTRAITSGPTIVYDASAAGSVGKAARVAWR